MDPFSLSVGCLALCGAIASAETRIRKLYVSLRGASKEMDDMTSQLRELRHILEILRNDGPQEDSTRVAIPSEAENRVFDHINKCLTAIQDLEDLIQGIQGERAPGVLWALTAKSKVISLTKTLRLHKDHLKWSINVFTGWSTRDIKSDTVAILREQMEIKADISAIRSQLDGWPDVDRFHTNATTPESFPAVSPSEDGQDFSYCARDLGNSGQFIPGGRSFQYPRLAMVLHSYGSRASFDRCSLPLDLRHEANHSSPWYPGRWYPSHTESGDPSTSNYEYEYEQVSSHLQTGNENVVWAPHGDGDFNAEYSTTSAPWAEEVQGFSEATAPRSASEPCMYEQRDDNEPTSSPRENIAASSLGLGVSTEQAGRAEALRNNFKESVHSKNASERARKRERKLDVVRELKEKVRRSLAMGAQAGIPSSTCTL